MSSKVQCAKCEGFGHIFFSYIFKPLVIKEHKDIGKKNIVLKYINQILKILIT